MKKLSSNNENYYQVVAGSTHFSTMQEAAIRELITHFHLETWRKGSIPFDELTTLRKFYVILKGRVKVYQVNENTGKEYIIEILHKGSLFDIICLLDGQQHFVLTEALDDVEALVAPMHIAREWLRQHPDFNQTLLPYLGRKMRFLEENSTDLALLSTWARTLKLFTKHLDRNANNHKLKLINNLSHTDLANIIGSARNVLNRHLQKLKKEDIIDIERSQIYIKNAEALIQKQRRDS